MCGNMQAGCIQGTQGVWAQHAGSWHGCHRLPLRIWTSPQGIPTGRLLEHLSGFKSAREGSLSTEGGHKMLGLVRLLGSCLQGVLCARGLPAHGDIAASIQDYWYTSVLQRANIYIQ